MSGPFGSSQWMYSSGGFYEFPIEQSLKFNDDDSSYLSWTPASAGNRKTWTWSGWVKRCKLGQLQLLFQQGSDANNATSFRINSDDTLEYDHADAGSTTYQAKTSAVFRDTSAWYHIVLAQNTTEATASDRIKVYVNGVEQSFSSSTYPSQNFDADVNTTNLFRISGQVSATLFPLDCYLAEVNFIDGTALDPTSFGEFKSGVWIPKDPSGLTYGTNGFRLSFQNDTVSEGFNTVTYRGNGGTQSINGIGFSPDFVWIKSRSEGSTSYTGHNVVQDSVRGTGVALVTNETYSESGVGYSDAVTAFNSDGFTLGSRNQVNYNNSNYVAWCWDAGNGSPVSNTDGSITSTVKANTAYGMSIITWTGAGGTSTIGHGLNSAPELIISKTRNVVNSWTVYAEPVGNDKRLILNSTNAASTDVAWGNTTPTSSVITLGSADTNGSSQTYVAYAFHSVTGYSKVGSYSGSGSSGNAITTGFKPAFVMVKRTDSTGNWVMFDATRSTQNTRSNALSADLSDREYTSADGVIGMDFTDTGFTLQDNHYTRNASGGTYIYIAFADTRDNAFWRDQSGNGNDWQPNNLTYQDSLPDSTTNNFATLNAVDKKSLDLFEGNLEFQRTSSTTDWEHARSTFQIPSSGKWYWEMSYNGTTTDGITSGVCLDTFSLSSDFAPSTYAGVWCWTTLAKLFTNNSNVTYGTSPSVGDVIMFAFDRDANELYVGKNGTWFNSSDPATNTSPAASSIPDNVFPFAGSRSTGNGTINFGQDSSFAGNKPAQGNTDDNGYGDFYYAPPSGYLALCTANLPDPVIDPAQDDVPSDYFNTVLYTGNETARSITGLDFQPSLTWIKSRSFARSSRLFDEVRGATKGLVSNSTDAELTQANELTSFDSGGFSLGNDYDTNANGQTYVAWNWLAGNGTSSNTDGSVTATISANPTSGFSIISATSPASGNFTVGHGLTKAPEVVIVKDRNSGSYYWPVFHASTMTSNRQFLRLNTTDAQATSGGDMWGSALPTSSVIGLSAGNVAATSNPFICYAFHSVEGFSLMGKYTGNGSSDGPFVYTGFRPAFVIAKRTDSANSWTIQDDLRDPDNPVDRYLLADDSSAEGTSGLSFDFLSNGFKLRTASGAVNASGGSYIFLTFAEMPFRYSNAR